MHCTFHIVFLLSRAVCLRFKHASDAATNENQEAASSADTNALGIDGDTLVNLPPEMPIVIDEQAVEDILGVSSAPNTLMYLYQGCGVVQFLSNSDSDSDSGVKLISRLATPTPEILKLKSRLPTPTPTPTPGLRIIRSKSGTYSEFSLK